MESAVTLVRDLAELVARASYEDLSDESRAELRIRVLDALGCAIGALGSGVALVLRAHTQELGGSPQCSLIGGGRTSIDRASFFNAALVRYLDFNDSYLAEGETCHPSDNLGPVLAAAELAGSSGRDLMTALAVAYQVHCRLSDVAPVRDKGFDHTTQGAYAVAAGVSRALGLDAERTAHAIAISGTMLNALRVTRTGALSHWKGLAYAGTAFAASHAALLARRGITGPGEVFEGTKGFMDTITGAFSIDWNREDFERVRWTVLKKYNAEVHSQSALEGLLDLVDQHGFAGGEVEQVRIEIFDVAYHIIGGGEEGAKIVIRSKEEADHSLPYLAAVALLDGAVSPAQYRPERIVRPDVQRLLRRVLVVPSEEMSRRFPAAMPCRVHVMLRDGRTFTREKEDYEGFHTRPMRWDVALEKFEHLSDPFASRELRREIADVVSNLDAIETTMLTDLLRRARAMRTMDDRSLEE